MRTLALWLAERGLVYNRISFMAYWYSSPPFSSGRKSEQNPPARVRIASREGSDTRREKWKTRAQLSLRKVNLHVVYQWYEELEFLVQVSLSGIVGIS